MTLTQDEVTEFAQRDFLDLSCNFYGEDGRPYLVRCPDCGKENYSMMVAAGSCAWCGFTAPHQCKS